MKLFFILDIVHRFLEKTYSTVVNHLKPDVIIFLGDLFDEGSIANNEQFSRYLTRFFNIFTTGFPIIVSNIYIYKLKRNTY